MDDDLNFLDEMESVNSLAQKMDPDQRRRFLAELETGRARFLGEAAERARSGSTASAKAERQATLQAEYEQAVRRPGTTKSERLNIRDQYRRRGLESLGGVEQQAQQNPQLPHDEALRRFRAEFKGAGSRSVKLVVRDRYRKLGLSEEELSSWKDED